MRALAVLLTAGVTAVVVSASAPARPAAGCIRATIGGRAVCLRAGAPCRARFAAQYRRRGFVCVGGRLRRIAAPKPAGPTVKTLVLPPAQPLPAGATTIDVAAANWNGGELAVAADALWIGSGLYRLDPQGNVSAALTSAESFDIGVGAGSVWA